MQLSQDVHTFTSASERLLSAGAIYRPLNIDEVTLIEYYCKELLKKLAPPSSNPPSKTFEPSRRQRDRHRGVKS